MPTIKFVNEKKTVEVSEGSNLRKAAMNSGVELYSGIFKLLNCRGFGLCTECRVCIKKGQENVSKQTWWERLNILKHPLAMFARLGKEDETRLACRTEVLGDVEVETKAAPDWHGEKFWAS